MHNHLSFLNHAENKIAFPSYGDFADDEKSDKRVTLQKHADVVDYLQRSSRETRISVIDIRRDVGVDLEGNDYNVLDMMKNNPKIDVYYENGELSFQYRAKFEIRNKYELLNTIDRVKSGVLFKDIEDCYPSIHADIQDMIMSGEIIAIKNKETRIQVYYPRQRPFLSKLCGEVTARPNDQYLITKEDLRPEIRRGDAILVNTSWFRVASNITNLSNSQPERAKAPLSVTSEAELSTRNEYYDEFSSRKLPLDGEYDGDDVYLGRPLKHGATNDVRDLWKSTLEKMKPFRDEKSLEAELLRLNLLTKLGTSAIKKHVIADSDSKRLKKRARRAPTKITNTHLKGTALGEIIAANTSVL